MLELCDGERTIEDIANELSKTFNGADIHADVKTLLDISNKREWS